MGYGLPSRFKGGVRGHHNNLDTGIHFLDRFQHFDPVHLTHLDIEKDEVGRCLAEKLQSIGTTDCRHHLIF